MKYFNLILLFLLITACDPWNFGFKKNPAFILKKAFNAINNLDEDSFLSISGREALCLYGNLEGLSFLRSHLTLGRAIQVKHEIKNSSYYTIPSFVGFWSYYQEIYQVSILDEKINNSIVDSLVECNYGTDEQKSKKLINLPKSKYPKKECRLIKIIPKKFESIKFDSKCANFRVSL
ncbi:MAG: hypothetical protein AB7I27_18175 [Bacteriovoracaceae bacterium]